MRLDGHGLLRKPEEQFPSGGGLSPVETKGEFVQVKIELLAPDGSLMRAQ